MDARQIPKHLTAKYCQPVRKSGRKHQTARNRHWGHPNLLHIQHPSENPVQNKVIYGELEDIREVAEGKTANFVVDDTVDTVFNSQADTITLTSSFTDINKGIIPLDKYGLTPKSLTDWKPKNLLGGKQNEND